jgi:hypothetical protein
LEQTLEKLKTSRQVLSLVESWKRGYEFRLKCFPGSMIQLTPTGKVNIWFRDFRYLERELKSIRKILVPKQHQELRITLSRGDARRLLHSLQGIFWALYPSEIQRKAESAAKKAKGYPPESIESQLAIAMPAHEAGDHIRGLVQTAMNRAWNRGDPNALFFLKPTGVLMRDLIAEALWAKEHGHYLTSTDMTILAMSKTCKQPELDEYNRLKVEARKLSPEEILELGKKERQERLNWITANQPWRTSMEGKGAFAYNGESWIAEATSKFDEKGRPKLDQRTFSNMKAWDSGQKIDPTFPRQPAGPFYRDPMEMERLKRIPVSEYPMSKLFRRVSAEIAAESNQDNH